MVRLELKQFEAVLADFRKAAELGEDGAVLHAGLGIAPEDLRRPAKADAASQKAFAREAPEAVRTRIAWIYGFAVSSRLPDKALQAFDDVLQRHPRHAHALYGRAMILARWGREQEAIALFGQVIDANPGLIEARRFRAILLTRAGKLTEASRDINWCLEQEPQGGATCYAAACVTALAADKYPDRTAAGQATDPDLAGLRRLPQFDQILREGSALSRRTLNN